MLTLLQVEDQTEGKRFNFSLFLFLYPKKSTNFLFFFVTVKLAIRIHLISRQHLPSPLATRHIDQNWYLPKYLFGLRTDHRRTTQENTKETLKMFVYVLALDFNYPHFFFER